MTDEYVASLEKRIEELEQQRAKLTYILRPYFKILIKGDEQQYEVKCLQLYLKVYKGVDPLQEWTSMGNIVGVQPVMNNTIRKDVLKWAAAEEDDVGEPSGKNLICHAESTGNKTWIGTMFRQGDESRDFTMSEATVDEAKQEMLKLHGLTGLACGYHVEPYVSKEERMKPAVDEITKQLSEWKAKSGFGLGVSSRGFNAWTIPATKGSIK